MAKKGKRKAAPGDLFIADYTDNEPARGHMGIIDAAPVRRGVLNDGSGQSFTRFDVPPATEPGNADSVTCFEDWRGSGFAAVYVTTGRWLLPGNNRFYVFPR